jgi:hypothetical protein
MKAKPASAWRDSLLQDGELVSYDTSPVKDGDMLLRPKGDLWYQMISLIS